MQDIAKKITCLLKANNMNQKKLAEKIGVTKQVISLICNGKTKNSKSLYEIAKYFGVEYHWLTNSGNDGGNSNDIRKNDIKSIYDDILVLDKFYKIPFITTFDIHKNLLSNGQLILKNIIAEKHEITSEPDHSQMFAMRASNNALKFKFGVNTTLIFHTGLTPISGDFIMVWLPAKELFVYRDLHIEGNKKTLIPLEEDLYKSLVMGENDVITAVLCEQRVKRPEPIIAS